jgi:hypothetical protein
MVYSILQNTTLGGRIALGDVRRRASPLGKWAASGAQEHAPYGHSPYRLVPVNSYLSAPCGLQTNVLALGNLGYCRPEDGKMLHLPFAESLDVLDFEQGFRVPKWKPRMHLEQRSWTAPIYIAIKKELEMKKFFLAAIFLGLVFSTAGAAYADDHAAVNSEKKY